MLDFVPNHHASDHPWVRDRPELLMAGTQALLEAEPANYYAAPGGRVLAHGRDPYFPAWPDTVQLDYGNPATGEAMAQQLLAAASRCDGLRCDMAMLILPDVFQLTWGRQAKSFWPSAIEAVRTRQSDFVFVAEVYWGLERQLLQQGFDYAYDKTLYDREIAQDGRGVREHLRAGLDDQRHLVRFLENHDEPRAAATFPWDVHQAAAIVTFLSPGLRFFHQGQFEGRTKRVPIHLNRAPEESPDPVVRAFYDRLLKVLQRPAVRSGIWRLLEPFEAWPGNWTWGGFVCFTWEEMDGARLLGTVNFQPHQAQCYVRLPLAGLYGASHDLVDLLGPARYRRDGDSLVRDGLYLDLPAWGVHLFCLEAAQQPGLAT